LAEATPFVEFMLAAMLDALDPVPFTDQASDQVISLIRCFKRVREMTTAGLMERLNLRHRPTFRKNYLDPALASGLVEMTDPDSPRSPTQRYRLTAKGQQMKT
jgi:hypothetical protein